MLAAGLYLNSRGIYHTEGIPFYHYILLGTLCGCISQIGDWAASAIKRYVGVKDYGRLMPGHGGVLDRFDSILFVAPGGLLLPGHIPVNFLKETKYGEKHSNTWINRFYRRSDP